MKCLNFVSEILNFHSADSSKTNTEVSKSFLSLVVFFSFPNIVQSFLRGKLLAADLNVTHYEVILIRL